MLQVRVQVALALVRAAQVGWALAARSVFDVADTGKLPDGAREAARGIEPAMEQVERALIRMVVS